MSTLAEWIAGRTPPAPEAFQPWLAAGTVIQGGAAPTLAEEAVRSLAEALARPGRNREGAFHLLAADGYLTYACEAAAEAADVEGTLRRILRRVADPGT